MDEIKVIAMEVNPPDSGRLPITEQFRQIEMDKRGTKFGESVKFIYKFAVRANELIKILEDEKPVIVHYSGHGTESGLTFIDNRGLKTTVSPEAIKNVFMQFKDTVKLVVLTACFSLPTAKVIAEEIDCAIGAQKELGSDEARTFASEFYYHLLSGSSVKRAFDMCKATLGMEKRDAPELVSRTGVDPSKMFLKNMTSIEVKPQVPTPGRGKRRYKVVAFDLDGTLLRGQNFNYSWELIWNYLNLDPNIRRDMMRNYRQEHWTYEEWCTECCDQLIASGLTYDMFQEILEPIKLTKNFYQAINRLKVRNYTLAIISGSVDTFLSIKIPNYLQIFDYVCINKLEFDRNGHLSGIIPTDYDFEGKATALEKICQRVGCSLNEAIWVGEGFNDDTVVIEVSNAGGLTFAYPPHDIEHEIYSTCRIDEDNLHCVVNEILSRG